MENIGADGMRISRPDLKYSKDVKVLVSGCSYTFGVGVPDKDTYVWRLNEICPEADFDNLGVGGYGPYRSYLRQERYMPLHKYDLLIYSMLANHLDRDSNHPNGIVHNFWARELALKLRENHLLEVGE